MEIWFKVKEMRENKARRRREKWSGSSVIETMMRWSDCVGVSVISSSGGRASLLLLFSPTTPPPPESAGSPEGSSSSSLPLTFNPLTSSCFLPLPPLLFMFTSNSPLVAHFSLLYQAHPWLPQIFIFCHTQLHNYVPQILISNFYQWVSLTLVSSYVSYCMSVCKNLKIVPPSLLFIKAKNPSGSRIWRPKIPTESRFFCKWLLVVSCLYCHSQHLWSKTSQGIFNRSSNRTLVFV